MGNNGPMAVATCQCGAKTKIRKYSLNSNIKKWGQYTCRKCALKHAGEKGSYDRSNSRDLSKDAKELWKNSGYSKQVASSVSASWDEERKSKLSMTMKERWEDPEYRKKIEESAAQYFANNREEFCYLMQQICGTKKFRKIASDNSIKNWDDPEYRERVIKSIKCSLSVPEVRERLSNNSKKIWENPEYRKRMARIRANQPRTSSIQEMLYGYLDDLGIEYFKEGDETAIGYYAFDCLVPKQGMMVRNLLIECQGDYWHTLKHNDSRDRSKFTYIDKYFPEYEIMYIWENEFYSKDGVIDRLKQRIGLDIKNADFSFSDINLVINPSDVNRFLDLYHYIGKGRGGITIGAKHGDKMVAVVVFSKPLRQNQSTFHGEFRELSRFCIHPSYHKRNFASWLLSKSIKKSGITSKIVAYADSTVGHRGTIYKAANFRYSHDVRPDYWYVNEDGYVMHKRTLYGKAVKMMMTESEYAEKFGYARKYGGVKKCYVYNT